MPSGQHIDWLIQVLICELTRAGEREGLRPETTTALRLERSEELLVHLPEKNVIGVILTTPQEESNGSYRRGCSSWGWAARW